MEPAISIRGLTKFYGAVRALDSFSMEVGEGEFFAFLGRNGAGKTTCTYPILHPMQLADDSTHSEAPIPIGIMGSSGPRP